MPGLRGTARESEGARPMAIPLHRCHWFLNAAKSSRLRPSESLESELQQVYAAARAAWPTVHLAEEEYFRHLGGRCSGAPHEVHAADLYLACACERRDSEAIRALEKDFLAHLSADLASLKPTRELIAEVHQRLLTKFILGEDRKRPKITSYS